MMNASEDMFPGIAAGDYVINHDGTISTVQSVIPGSILTFTGWYSRRTGEHDHLLAERGESPFG